MTGMRDSPRPPPTPLKDGAPSPEDAPKGFVTASLKGRELRFQSYFNHLLRRTNSARILLQFPAVRFPAHIRSFPRPLAVQQDRKKYCNRRPPEDGVYATASVLAQSEPQSLRRCLMKPVRTALLSVLAATTLGLSTQASAGTTLDAVMKKGYVQCGVSDGLPGFSFTDAQGNFKGIDVDVCRAVAAAIFLTG